MDDGGGSGVTDRSAQLKEVNAHAHCNSHDIDLHVGDIPPDSRASDASGSCDTLSYTHDGSSNVQILASAHLKAPSVHQTTHLVQRDSKKSNSNQKETL